MKINFTGHSATEREVEITPQEMKLLFEVMKQKFLDNIEYGKFNYSFPSSDQLVVTKLCDDYQIDVDYEKDRVAFFTAIVDKMENTYA